MGKTVKVILDCGDAGKVVWDLPRDGVKEGLSDREIQRLMAQAWGDSAKLFFGVVRASMMLDADNMSTIMTELDAGLKDIARRAARRAM